MRFYGEDFGIIGDGVADDTMAFQAALDAAGICDAAMRVAGNFPEAKDDMDGIMKRLTMVVAQTARLAKHSKELRLTLHSGTSEQTAHS